MSVDPVVSGAGTSSSRQGPPPGPARWAVVVAAVAAVLVLLGVVVFAVGYAVGGDEGVSDNWVGMLTVFSVLSGLLASFIAFVVAVVTRLRHRSVPGLWLPLTVFPVVIAFIVLGEAFWWE